jgi:hypothetical protein
MLPTPNWIRVGWVTVNDDVSVMGVGRWVGVEGEGIVDSETEKIKK